MTKQRSAATWAVLGLVIERPSYGYELAMRFGRRFDGVLTFSTAGVYSALDSLSSAQDIELLPQTGGKRQPKPHYKATAQGAGRYRGWMVASLRDETQPTEVISRLATTVLRDPSVMLLVLDEYERLCLRDATSQPVLDELAPGDDTPQTLMDRLVVQHRRASSLGALEWIELARAEIEAFASRSGIELG